MATFLCRFNIFQTFNVALDPTDFQTWLSGQLWLACLFQLVWRNAFRLILGEKSQRFNWRDFIRIWLLLYFAIFIGSSDLCTLIGCNLLPLFISRILITAGLTDILGPLGNLHWRLHGLICFHCYEWGNTTLWFLPGQIKVSRFLLIFLHILLLYKNTLLWLWCDAQCTW